MYMLYSLLLNQLHEIDQIIGDLYKTSSALYPTYGQVKILEF
jgi:hypothetical protein